MRKRVQIALGVLLILLIVICAVLAFASLHRAEPVYRGNTLSYWLQQYNEVQDIRKLGPADEAIRAIGTNALPRLLADLGRGASISARMLASWSARHRWIRLPFYGEDHYKAPALLALKALGPEAKPIGPGLQRLLNRPQSMDTAAMGFSMIGRAAIPALEEACRTTNVTVRVEAAVLIARIKTPPGIAYGYGWHKSPINGRPVLNVGWALVFNTEQQTLQSIVEELRNPDPAIRLANLDALRSVAGPPSKSASSILVELLVDGNANVVKAAQETLKQVDPQEAPSSGVK